MQQSTEYNKNEADANTQNKPVVTTAGRDGRRGDTGVEGWEGQTIRPKIGYKGILYNTGNIANILQEL